MTLSLTLIIIIITTLISIGGFNNQKIKDDLIFYPPSITQRNQWYRFSTSACISWRYSCVCCRLLSNT